MMEVIAEATQPDDGIETKDSPTDGSAPSDPLVGVIRQRLGLPQESTIVVTPNAFPTQDKAVGDSTDAELENGELIDEIVEEIEDEVGNEEVNDIEDEDGVVGEELKDSSSDSSSPSDSPNSSSNNPQENSDGKNNNTIKNNKQNAQSKNKKAAAVAAAAAAAKKQAEEKKQQERVRYNKVSWSICDGQNCKGCWEFVSAGNGIGNPCKNCGCSMISHIPSGDDVDTDFAEEDYISEYGGEESW